MVERLSFLKNILICFVNSCPKDNIYTSIDQSITMYLHKTWSFSNSKWDSFLSVTMCSLQPDILSTCPTYLFYNKTSKSWFWGPAGWLIEPSSWSGNSFHMFVVIPGTVFMPCFSLENNNNFLSLCRGANMKTEKIIRSICVLSCVCPVWWKHLFLIQHSLQLSFITTSSPSIFSTSCSDLLCFH